MTRLLAALIALLVAPLLCAAEERIGYGNYYALVIGNNEYAQLPRLRTAVADAAAVAELLRSRYAFADVTLLLNATRADILKQMNRLRAALTEEDNLLIYYAGHGYLDRGVGEGYWLPVDAAEDDDTNWIKNDRLTDYLRAMAARHILVIADSCYAGTLTRSGTGGPPTGVERAAWLRRMASKRARTALSSGGIEPVTDGGEGGHSVFAGALLEALRENAEVLDGQTLYQRLKRRVVLNAEQTPEYADVRGAAHEGGDFLFVPRERAVAVTPPPAPTLELAGLAALDLALWNSVKDSNDPVMLEAYLDRFPGGTFAAVARWRLAQLGDGSAPAQRRSPASAPPPLPQQRPPIAAMLRPVEVPFVVLRDANVRAEPSTASTSLDTLAAGSEVRVAGRTADGDWLAIKLPDGGLAYVHASLLLDKATYQSRQRRSGLAGRVPVPGPQGG